MNDFPEFMRNSLNAIDPKSQSPGNVGYVYDGIDGRQMAIWTSKEDVISKEHVHDYDEYFIVVEGEYKLKISGETIILRRGDEYHVLKGTPHSGESTHSSPRSEARGMLRVDTERRFLPRFKNRSLALSNVSKKGTRTIYAFGSKRAKRINEGQ